MSTPRHQPALPEEDRLATGESGQSAEIAPDSPAAPAAAAEPDNQDSPAYPGEALKALEPPPFLRTETEVDPAPASESLPADLRVPWSGRDTVFFLLFYLLSPLVIAGPLLLLAAISKHEDPTVLQKDPTVLAVVSLIAQGIAAALSLLYLQILLRARGAAEFWRTLGWRGLGENGGKLIGSIVGGGILLAVGVALVSKVVGENKTLPIEQLVQTRVALTALMLYAISIAPFIEETVFRGFLYPALARRAGIAAGIVTTGILFGLVHSLQLWGGWGQIALIIGVGIVLTWLRARQQTVVASYLLHLSYNTTLFVGAFAATGGFRHM